VTRDVFPELKYSRWSETRDTLHLFLQIIGKIRMTCHPKLNHWWHVTLYPSTRGLTTGRIPHSNGGFEIVYDMVEHNVNIIDRNGNLASFSVVGKSVAEFYAELMKKLVAFGIEVSIYAVPYDNKSTVPFAKDSTKRAYDKDAVTRYWKALCAISSVFEVFRGRFAGKQTPVQLFWHSFDLVVTRFSGRAHPLEKGRQSDIEAYSHEVISIGFWPGDDSFQEAAFYGYAYPEPAGLAETLLQPPAAEWTQKNGGALAILRYDDIRRHDNASREVLSFLQSVYDHAADKADWPVDALRHAYMSHQNL